MGEGESDQQSQQAEYRALDASALLAGGFRVAAA